MKDKINNNTEIAFSCNKKRDNKYCLKYKRTRKADIYSKTLVNQKKYFSAISKKHKIHQIYELMLTTLTILISIKSFQRIQQDEVVIIPIVCIVFLLWNKEIFNGVEKTTEEKSKIIELEMLVSEINSNLLVTEEQLKEYDNRYLHAKRNNEKIPNFLLSKVENKKIEPCSKCKNKQLFEAKDEKEIIKFSKLDFENGIIIVNKAEKKDDECNIEIKDNGIKIDNWTDSIEFEIETKSIKLKNNKVIVEMKLVHSFWDTYLKMINKFWKKITKAYSIIEFYWGVLIIEIAILIFLICR